MNKEFLYSDLFKLLPQAFKVSKLEFNEHGKTPAYSSDTRNNGCLGYVDREPLYYVTEDCPVYLVFGDHTKTMNIVHKSFCVMDNVKVLLPIIKMSDQVLLFITTAWKKSIPDLGYARHWSVAKIAKISLPVVEHADPNHEYTVDDIDWQYMEDRIKELEEDRIKELEAYLKATNLDDYELTDEDKKILSLSRKSALNKNSSLETDCQNGALRFKKFNIGDLFDVINNPQLDKKNFIFSERAKYPYFTRTENNNGIYGYVRYYDDDHLIPGNSLAVGMISMQFHYMHHDFYAGQFTKTLIPRFGEFNENLAMYFIAILNNHSEYYQSYLVRHFKEKISETVVELPAASNGEPDFVYMERYIRAIEKLTIADVVKYKDKVIDTTKMLVNSQS